MDIIFIILALSVVTEALIEYTKSIADMIEQKSYKPAVLQLAAVALAVMLCIFADINLFDFLNISFSSRIVGVVITGIIASRGANYISDLIGKINSKKQAK